MMPIQCTNPECEAYMHRMAVTYWCPECETEIPYRDEAPGDGVAFLFAEVNGELKDLPVKVKKGDSVTIVASHSSLGRTIDK